MRAMKVFAAIIVSLVLLATQAAALILGAVRTSLTAEAISGAIKNADLSGAAARPGPPLLTVRPRLFGAGGYEALELGDEDLEELRGALTRGGLKDVLGGLLRDRADRLGIKPEEADEIFEAIGTGFRQRGAIPLLSDEELRRLTMPVLLVSGVEDAVQPAAKIAKRLKRFLPRLQVELLPRTGHLLLETTRWTLPFLLGEEAGLSRGDEKGLPAGGRGRGGCRVRGRSARPTTRGLC